MTGPARVLHLIDTGGPGGAETVYLEIVAGLDPDRFASVAAVPEVDWLAGALERRGIEPLVLPSQRSFDVPHLLALLRTARRRGVNLVQTHLLGSAVYGNLAGRIAGLPVVSTFHGTPDVAGDDPLLRAKFRILDRDGCRLVFVSRALRARFAGAGLLPRGRGEVIHNGIDTARFRRGDERPLRDRLGVAPDELLVGAVGNLRPAKAYDVLLRAAARLSGASPTCRFVVVGQGSGPLREELLALRRELGLEDRFHFLDFEEDVPAVLSSLDLFVLSSRSEGFSLSTVEAMACGLPVVATRSGGPEEIVEDGRTGVLVHAGDPDALAAAIRGLADDADARRRLARQAETVARERFPVSRMVADYERLYERALGRAAAGARSAGRGEGARAG